MTTTPEDALKDDLQFTLVSMIDTANGVIPDYVEQHRGNKVELAGALKTLREAMKMMRDADAMLEGALIEAGVEYGGENLTGVGMTHIHRAGKKTIYDNPMVISKFSQALHEDINKATEDGEIISREEAMQIAVDKMAKLTGAATKSYSGWRKTEAKKLGIDLNQYATEEGGRLSVRFE